MRRRNKDKAEPLWVATLSDMEVVEKFKALTERSTFTYESIGRYVVDMRKRLLLILIDGLAAKVADNDHECDGTNCPPQAHDHKVLI